MTAKDIAKIIFNLVVIYVIGGLVLSGVYAITSPIIYKNKVRIEEKALKELLPDAKQIEQSGEWTIHEKTAKYFTAKKNNEIIGYVIQSFGKGYSSYINTFIAVDKDFKVIKINVLSHAETPGLGDEIETDWFKNQFKGKNIEHMKVIKTETTEDIEAISGATISSRAVTEDAVKNSIAFLIKTFKEEGSENAAGK